ncbi:transcriptional regulator OPI1 LALA0_S02e00804g [Lachancea lanzarotensis]|uniref:LALA0S02e00804g1_1 n=1 Tax=Lachancea lanzarotensis TaxID=1245769 RepID=A0A0C7MZ16_9SACH|nr:uncharacterized protein LALA0_S02e00804g [Lachancea lanzarotensis]CEP60839.1 LALA0S02e00804g1_1 [Lachancea lanzarotensis]
MQIKQLENEPSDEIPEDIALAVEALTELKNSHGPGGGGGGGQFQEHELQEQKHQQDHNNDDTLLAKVRTNTLIDNAVKVYKKSKNQYPKFRKGAEMVERKALLPMVKRLEEHRTNKRRLESIARQEVEELLGAETENEIDEEIENTGELRSSGQRRSKKQKISSAIAKSKSNLKGYQLNMSIESKKRLVTCLHLLKLANYQLSNRVSFLQDLVHKEQQLRRGRLRDNNITGRKIENRGEKSRSGIRLVEKINEERENKANSNKHDRQDENEPTLGSEGEDDDDDEDDEEAEDHFYDASDNLHEQSDVVKMEIVGTVKKVYSLVSRFTGNSLPEPARTQVRESLLQLPSAWTSSMNSETLSKYTHSKKLTRNGKVLILAQESLGMVHSVMDIVDGTLGRAEEWVKQKQEIKELLKEQYLSNKIRDPVKNNVSGEKEVD